MPSQTLGGGNFFLGLDFVFCWGLLPYFPHFAPILFGHFYFFALNGLFLGRGNNSEKGESGGNGALIGTRLLLGKPKNLLKGATKKKPFNKGNHEKNPFLPERGKKKKEAVGERKFSFFFFQGGGIYFFFQGNALFGFGRGEFALFFTKKTKIFFPGFWGGK